MSCGMRAAHQGQQLFLVRGLQLALELVSRVEVVLDGTFVAAGHKDHVADACGIGFFHRVLDQWLVHDRQHFLGLGLGRGQEASAQSSHRKNCFVNLCDFFHRLVVHLPLKFAHFFWGASPNYLAKRRTLL